MPSNTSTYCCSTLRLRSYMRSRQRSFLKALRSNESLSLSIVRLVVAIAMFSIQLPNHGRFTPRRLAIVAQQRAPLQMELLLASRGLCESDMSVVLPDHQIRFQQRLFEQCGRPKLQGSPTRIRSLPFRRQLNVKTSTRPFYAYTFTIRLSTTAWGTLPRTWSISTSAMTICLVCRSFELTPTSVGTRRRWRRRQVP
jgi:hypothetical protein